MESLQVAPSAPQSAMVVDRRRHQGRQESRAPWEKSRAPWEESRAPWEKSCTPREESRAPWAESRVSWEESRVAWGMPCLKRLEMGTTQPRRVARPTRGGPLRPPLDISYLARGPGGTSQNNTM